MAAPAVNGTIDPEQYVVERTGETARLQAQAKRRKPMLIFGPEKVGKTRLLKSFVREQPLTLSAADFQSPGEVLLTPVEELRCVARWRITDGRLPGDDTGFHFPAAEETGNNHRALCCGRN